MKTVLVPVDYSSSSKSALLYALKMAQKASLNVVVFHAFHPMVSPPAAYDIPAIIPALEKEKVLELEQYVKDSKSLLPEDVVINYTRVEGTEQSESSPNHAITIEKGPHERYANHVTYVAKTGSVYEQITKAAEANKADLIVMGMQGGGALSQVLIGSTTASVMRNSRIPVLGVPLGAKFYGFKLVVFAADLGKQPNQFLLAKLQEFVKTFRSKLQVLHIDKHQGLQPDDERLQPALEQLDEQLNAIDFKVILQQRADAATGIQEYLQEHKPDLLILNPKKHNVLERLLDKSVTSKMIAYNHQPLLTLPVSNITDQHVVEEELKNTEKY